MGAMQKSLYEKNTGTEIVLSDRISVRGVAIRADQELGTTGGSERSWITGSPVKEDSKSGSCTTTSGRSEEAKQLVKKRFLSMYLFVKRAKIGYKIGWKLVLAKMRGLIKECAFRAADGVFRNDAGNRTISSQEGIEQKNVQFTKWLRLHLFIECHYSLPHYEACSWYYPLHKPSSSTEDLRH